MVGEEFCFPVSPSNNVISAVRQIELILKFNSSIIISNYYCHYVLTLRVWHAQIHKKETERETLGLLG